MPGAMLEHVRYSAEGRIADHVDDYLVHPYDEAAMILPMADMAGK